MLKRRKYRKWETTNSRITSVLRRLWMWSRERNFALKQAKRTCQVCGARENKKRGSEVKLEVHHISPANFERIREVIREELLINPDKLIVLCKKCHAKKHKKKG